MVETKRPETPGTMASQSWVQKLSISSLTSNKKIKHIKAFHSEASSEFKKVVRVVKLHTLLRYSGKKKKKKTSTFELTPWEFAKEWFSSYILQTKHHQRKVFKNLDISLCSENLADKI